MLRFFRCTSGLYIRFTFFYHLLLRPLFEKTTLMLQIMLMAIPRMSLYQTLIFSLKRNTERIFRCFHIYRDGTGHLIISSKENLEVQVSKRCMKIEDSVKILGIGIEVDLIFDNRLNQLCQKASKKLHALTRNARWMDINNQRITVTPFVSF